MNHDDTVGQLDPDNMFAKYSVSEMRAVQHRLRADADAKQEELRLMVGYVQLAMCTSMIVHLYYESVGNATVTYCKRPARSYP